MTNILNEESSELKKGINDYFDSKLKEFQLTMKSNIDEIITNKLETFYGNVYTETEYDDILFDSDGSDAIKLYNAHSIKENANQYNTYKHQLLPTNENKCFIIQGCDFNPNGSSPTHYNYYFKTFYIYRIKYPSDQWRPETNSMQLHKHNYTTDQLFAIKYNQFAFNNHGNKELSYCKGHYKNISNLSLEKPEYLRKTHSKFEEICEREHVEIASMKSELEELLQESIDKKEYYESLEMKITNIKLEKQYLDDEKVKIEKEKKDMVFIKEKLLEMKNKLELDKDELAKQKREFELDKQEFARQKNITPDFNKCFEDILKN